MKIKTLFLIMILLLLCGCSAEVNLEINNKKVIEDISINALVDNINDKESLKTHFREYMPVFNEVMFTDVEPDTKLEGISYYNRTVKELGTGFLYNYKYTFDFSNYNKARSLKRTFRSAVLEENKKDNTITLYTDKSGIVLMNEYSNFTELIINIKTDYKVLENNADSVNENVYTWKFTQTDNKKNIYLKMSLEKNEESDKISKDDKKEKTKEEETIYEKYWYLVLLACLGLFFVIVYVINKVANSKYE